LYYGSKYERPMKVFLNRYMATNRDLQRQEETALRSIFGRSIACIRQAKGDRVFRIAAALNAAVFDSVMTGVALRLARGDIAETAVLAEKYDELLKDPDYLLTVQRATADEDSVRTRLTKAEAAFAQVP